MTRPPGRRGGGGRAPKIRRTGGRRAKSTKGCRFLALVIAGSGLMLTSGAAGLALVMVTK